MSKEQGIAYPKENKCRGEWQFGLWHENLFQKKEGLNIPKGINRHKENR